MDVGYGSTPWPEPRIDDAAEPMHRAGSFAIERVRQSPQGFDWHAGFAMDDGDINPSAE